MLSCSDEDLGHMLQTVPKLLWMMSFLLQVGIVKERSGWPHRREGTLLGLHQIPDLI